MCDFLRGSVANRDPIERVGSAMLSQLGVDDLRTALDVLR